MPSPNKIQHWLIDPEVLPEPEAYAIEAKAELREQMKAAAVTLRAAAGEDFWAPQMEWARPYEVVNRRLIVPVQGMLLNKFPYHISGWFTATGYEYIYQAVSRGLGDTEVDEIILDIDSGGGLVAGCFELCDDIRAHPNRAAKPITAVAGGHGAYSAAYAVFCCADPGRGFVEQSAGTGSVGVVTMHVDYSEAMKDSGIKVTFVFAGKHKVDGNPYEPLAKDTKERWQKRVERTYDIFVAHVARGRQIAESAVRETEALTFDAQESIEKQFADGVARLVRVIAEDFNPLDSGARAESVTSTEAETGETGDTDMSANDAAPKTEANAKVEDNTKVETPAPVDTAAIAAEARAAERARFAAVQASEDYAGREALASHLLNNTDMTAEAISAALKAAPAAASRAGDPGFNKKMDTSDNPDLAAAPSGSGPETQADKDAEIVAANAEAAKAIAGTARRSRRVAA